MTSEDLFDEIIARLWRVRVEVSDATFRVAAGAALVAIARSVLDEAERRAKRDPSAKVVRFPSTPVPRLVSSDEET